MSGYLLDTNIPSELTKPLPDSRVSDWVKAQENTELFLSVVSVGELRRGVAELPKGKRRMLLEQWLDEDLIPLFGDRILPVTRGIREPLGYPQRRA